MLIKAISMQGYKRPLKNYCQTHTDFITTALHLLPLLAQFAANITISCNTALSMSAQESALPLEQGVIQWGRTQPCVLIKARGGVSNTEGNLGIAQLEMKAELLLAKWKARRRVLHCKCHSSTSLPSFLLGLIHGTAA